MSGTIAIVGGGLGGLLLARILQQHGTVATVYELDDSADARQQGGSLDIHSDSGQLALREGGLYDAFRRSIIVGGEDCRIYDGQGKLWLDHKSSDEPGGRPEIDRTVLRALLLASVEPRNIRWGHKLATATPLGDGRHALGFTNGEKVTADLVIGADGAWSKVRRLVSEAVPVYSGVSFLEVHLPNADVEYAAAAALVGRGMMFALGHDRALFAHRGGDGELRVYAGLRVPVEWAAAKNSDWRAVARAAFADWNPTLLAMFSRDDVTISARQIHALPIGHAWPRVPGVTLLGDAAHLMTPFAGEGANLALVDAAELARELCATPADREGALARYEAAMFPRAAASTAESAAGLEACLAVDAPRGIVEQMMAHDGPV